MPGYKSNPGGLFNSGVQPDSRPQVDLGGLLQAVGSGTGSIIHSIMARRMAENQLATQQQELALRQDQAKREGEQQVWERGFKEKELKEKSDANRRQDAINGLVVTPGSPARDETSQVPLTPLQAPTSPIARAASQRGGMPPVQAPIPAAMTATVHNPRVAQTERTQYDPTQSLSYVRGMATANARADAAEEVARTAARSRETVAQTGATSREAVANTRASSSEKIAKQREAGRLAGINRAGELAGERQKAAIAAKSAGPISKAMTAAQKDKIAVDGAIGFLTAHQGATFDDALDTFNNTDQGKSLQASGITEDHLLRAFGKMKKDPTTGQILGMIQSGAAVESSKGAGDAAQVAGKMVRDAKTAAAPPRFRAQEPSANTGPSSSTTATKPKLAAPGAQTPSDSTTRAAAVSWQKANPQAAGETDDAYYARFKKANP